MHFEDTRYKRFAVRCLCGWRGKRGNRQRWPACPNIQKGGTHQVTFVDNNRVHEVPSANTPITSEEAAARLTYLTAEINRMHASIKKSNHNK